MTVARLRVLVFAATAAAMLLVVQAPRPVAANIVVSITIDKGAGATYTVGETLQACFQWESPLNRTPVSYPMRITLQLPDGSSRVAFEERLQNFTRRCITSPVGLPVGQKTLRADLIAPSNGTVMGTASVSYLARDGSSSGAGPGQGVTISVSVDRPGGTYVEGDPITICVTVSRPIHVRLTNFVNGARNSGTDLGQVSGQRCGTTTIAPPLGSERILAEAIELGDSLITGGRVVATADATYRSVPRQAGPANTGMVTIQKQIVDANNNPVPGASLNNYQFTINCSGQFFTGTTGANGQTTIGNVTAGQCSLQEAAPAGFTFVSFTQQGGAAVSTNPGPVTVPAGQTVFVTVVNRQGASIPTPAQRASLAVVVTPSAIERGAGQTNPVQWTLSEGSGVGATVSRRTWEVYGCLDSGCSSLTGALYSTESGALNPTLRVNGGGSATWQDTPGAGGCDGQYASTIIAMTFWATDDSANAVSVTGHLRANCARSRTCPDGSVLPPDQPCPPTKYVTRLNSVTRHLVTVDITDNRRDNARITIRNNTPMTVEIAPETSGVSYASDYSLYAAILFLPPFNAFDEGEAKWRAQWPNSVTGRDDPTLAMHFEVTPLSFTVHILQFMLGLTAFSSLPNALEKIADARQVIDKMKHLNSSLEHIKSGEFSRIDNAAHELYQSFVDEEESANWVEVAKILEIDFGIDFLKDALFTVPNKILELLGPAFGLLAGSEDVIFGLR
jgi:hypothetical protein